MYIDTLAESITEHVLEHVDLSEYAYIRAESVTGVNRNDLESVEGTAQHRLFYSIYAEEQVRVVNMVVQKLLSYPDR